MFATLGPALRAGLCTLIAGGNTSAVPCPTVRIAFEYREHLKTVQATRLLPPQRLFRQHPS
jgi:hypothetical protein